MNKVTDALSWRHELLITLQIEITNFDSLPELYATDEDFLIVRTQCNNHELGNVFHIQEGYLFKGNGLRIPKTTL